MAKRLDETQDFINTVLSEANWTQANIKVKLNEEKAEDDTDDEGEDDKGDDEKQEESVELYYDACPLCESELEDDNVIFENIDTHFSNLLNIVDQAQAIQEGEDADGELVIESVTDDDCCPLCESTVEDDSIILANMNEHFDVVLEMLDELQDNNEDETV